MRTAVSKAVVTASVLAFGGLAAACGGSDDATGVAAPSSVSAAPVATSAPESAASSTKPSPASKTLGPGQSSSNSPDTGETAGPPVDCGPIDAPHGKVGLIASETKAGRPGCAEAINVITAYFQNAPKEAEGTAHVLNVSGWRCMADTGAQGSGRIGCDKDGLVFYTQP